MEIENTLVSDEDRRFMKMACELARENVECGGAPFGAVVVKSGEVIATGCHSVTIDNDSTAHAVVNAIRHACRSIHSYKLDGCVVYCNCEPCPMCEGALYCAGVSCIYYGNSADDAESTINSDNFIYKDIKRPHQE